MGKEAWSDTIVSNMGKKTEEKTIEEMAEKMLSLLGIEGEVGVSEDLENSAVKVGIEANDAAVLIGRRGETIDAFQLLLNQIYYKTSGEWKRILVDVGNYRTRQGEYLQKMAQEAAAVVKETGKPQAIFSLSASDRRVIHMALADNPDVVTGSEGEGRERHIVVKLKTSE